MMNQHGEVVIAILNNPLDSELAHRQHWYRIPITSQQKWLKRGWPPTWLAFYQTKVFGSEAYAIHYYARVIDIQQKYRWELLPEQPQDERGERHSLDFAIYCTQGKLDIETDGDEWHANPERAEKDNLRDNDLESQGWQQLRFTSRQIQEQISDYCIPKIAQTINYLGGVQEEGRLVARKINPKMPPDMHQPTLFDS